MELMKKLQWTFNYIRNQFGSISWSHWYNWDKLNQKVFLQCTCRSNDFHVFTTFFLCSVLPLSYLCIQVVVILWTTHWLFSPEGKGPSLGLWHLWYRLLTHHTGTFWNGAGNAYSFCKHYTFAYLFLFLSVHTYTHAHICTHIHTHEQHTHYTYAHTYTHT